MENGETNMARAATKKIRLKIDSGLYANLTKVAKENEQSRRFLLEQALKLYFQVVVPS